MNQGQTLFGQGMAHVPHRDFQRCVKRYGGDARVRRFTCWDHSLTPPSVHEMLKRVEKAGLISRDPGRARLVSEDEIPRLI